MAWYQPQTTIVTLIQYQRVVRFVKRNINITIMHFIAYLCLRTYEIYSYNKKTRCEGIRQTDIENNFH